MRVCYVGVRRVREGATRITASQGLVHRHRVLLHVRGRMEAPVMPDHLALIILVAVCGFVLVRQFLGDTFRRRPDEPHACSSCGAEATYWFPEGWLCLPCTLKGAK